MVFTSDRRAFQAPVRAFVSSILFGCFSRFRGYRSFAIVACSFAWAGSAQGQALFSRHVVDSNFSGAHAVQAYDLDGDGDLDFVGASMNIGKISWWENVDGTGLVWTQYVVADVFTGARFIDAADLDGDGDLDLYGAAASLDAVTWWENTLGNASEWAEHAVDTEFDFAMHVHAADLDADGDLDLLGAALKGDAVTWWENLDGVAATWERHVVVDTFDGARHVCAVDIDGDGDADLLGSADIANTVMWWENTAGDASAWKGFVIDSTFEGVNGVLPADMDGDGDVDLVGAADIADDIVWWKQLDGDSLSWQKMVVDPNFDGAFSVAPADMDNDGDLDILGAAAEADQVFWWENVAGNGEEWLEQIVDDAFDYPIHINAADIDNDGDTDVLAGAFEGAVVWWENPIIEVKLPVELVSFDLIVDRNDVLLSWRTASETNNAGFEVQHVHTQKNGGATIESPTGAWQSVSFVEGAGTSFEPRSYTYSLVDLLPGRHRFRLKQIDFDGRFAYSAVAEIQINLNAAHNMSDVYPNPFNPEARFYLSLAAPQEVEIDVYNALGQRVARLHKGMLDANEAYAFDFEANDLPGGLYVIHASGETFSTSRKAMLVK